MEGAALLIGNANYQPLPPLQTPVSDVRNLARRLQMLGFRVTAVENADHSAMIRHIDDFRGEVERLAPNSSVLFYFAGHGVQFGGENFLIPIDAKPPANGRWRLRALELSTLLDELCFRDDQQKLIALDACRTNGIISESRSGALGLSGFSTDRQTDVNETMILYAAPPGQIASDGGALGSSPFCRALLDALEQPDRPLTILAPEISRNVKAYTDGKQVPWKTDNLIEQAAMPFWRKPPPSSNANGVPLNTSPLPSAAVVPSRNFQNPIDAEVAGKGHLIHKLKAKDTTGKWAYYFILVEPQKEAEFLRAIEGSGAIDVEHYGAVVASCYGESPTNEVRAYLYEKYGFVV